jgi:hypothetical protein
MHYSLAEVPNSAKCHITILPNCYNVKPSNRQTDNSDILLFSLSHFLPFSLSPFLPISHSPYLPFSLSPILPFFLSHFLTFSSIKYHIMFPHVPHGGIFHFNMRRAHYSLLKVVPCLVYFGVYGIDRISIRAPLQKESWFNSHKGEMTGKSRIPMYTV